MGKLGDLTRNTVLALPTGHRVFDRSRVKVDDAIVRRLRQANELQLERTLAQMRAHRWEKNEH